MQVLYVRQNQSVPGDPRDAGPRRDARRHQPLLVQRQTAVPLHGHVDVLELHRAAGNRGGEDPRRRAVRQGLLHRLRRDHRHRRGDQHRESRAGRERRGIRPRRHRPQRDSGRASGRRESHHRRRHESVEETARREIRHDRLRQSEGGRQPRCDDRRDDRRRRRLFVRVHRQRQRDAPGARVLPQGLGREHHHRRGRQRDRKSARGRSSW